MLPGTRRVHETNSWSHGLGVKRTYKYDVKKSTHVSFLRYIVIILTGLINSMFDLVLNDISI